MLLGGAGSLGAYGYHQARPFSTEGSESPLQLRPTSVNVDLLNQVGTGKTLLESLRSLLVDRGAPVNQQHHLGSGCRRYGATQQPYGHDDATKLLAGLLR